MSSGASSADDGREASLGRRIVARAGQFGRVLSGTGALLGAIPALAVAHGGRRRPGSNGRTESNGGPAEPRERARTAGGDRDVSAAPSERVHRELRADVRGAVPAADGAITRWGTAVDPDSQPTLWLSTDPRDGSADCRPLADDGFVVARALTRAHGDGVVLAGNRSPSADAATSDVVTVAVDPAGQVRARHVVDRPAFACCSALCRSADGGYLLAGGSMAADETYTRPWVLKLDDRLNPVWRTNGVRGEGDCPRIVRDRGDRIVLIDGRGDPDEPLRYRSLDRDGAPIDARLIQGTAGVHVRGAAEAGGLVLTGHRLDDGGAARLWVAALDADGRRRWDRTSRRAAASIGHDVVETADGLAVAGERTGPAGRRRAAVVTIDRSGTWQHEWTFEHGASARSVWVTGTDDARSDDPAEETARRQDDAGHGTPSERLAVAGIALNDSRRPIPWDATLPAGPR